MIVQVWRPGDCLDAECVAKLHPAERRSFCLRTGAAIEALIEGKGYEENGRE